MQECGESECDGGWDGVVTFSGVQEWTIVSFIERYCV